MPDLRIEFFNCLIELAKKDKSIIFLTGDLGYSKFEKYRDKFPKRFINCGCIEQSMVGIVAGMALAGKKPYVYSTVPFILFRAYEQMRDDICYQNANVKLIGAKVSSFLGFSHNLEGKENEEDLLKNLPNLQRYYPINEKELKQAMDLVYKSKLPAFIKI